MLDIGTISSIAGLFGVSANQLWKVLRQHRKHAQDAIDRGRTAAIIEASRRIVLEGLNTAFANKYYDTEVLRSAGLTRYVVDIQGVEVMSSLATRPGWVGTRVPLRSASEHCVLLPQPPSVIVPELEDTASILAGIESRGITIWNAPIFRLLGVEIDGSILNAEFCTDDFFRYRFTNGALHDELTEALVDTDFKLDFVIEKEEKLLPRRRRYLPPNGSLIDFDTRICASGVNVLTAFARPHPNKDFAVILQRRGASVATRQWVLSLLPGGHHQPTLEPELEVAISRTIMRELFEEVFGGEEVERGSTRLQVDWYERASEPIGWFQEHGGAFDLVTTGLGISLLSGSVTFATVLVVYDEDFWRKYNHEMRTNWEVSDNLSPVLSTKDSRLKELLRKREWMDYSFQAVIEGMLFLREKSPERVMLPEIKRQPGGALL